jgi:BirA family biotin operon repressor/biotin-[acetyl-CoA-carboxylase] ligase
LLSGTRFSDGRWIEETGSTNADLLADARAGLEHERVLIAEHQTAGRGRLERRWIAPPGASLLLSVLVYPRLDRRSWFWYTAAMGVSALDAIGGAPGVEYGASLSLRLKWPNDLVVAEPARGSEPERKFGGLLAEAATGPTRTGLVVGIGINVAWPAQLPPEISDTATALNLVGLKLDRLLLARHLLRRFSSWCDRLDNAVEDPAAVVSLRTADTDRLATLDRDLDVVLPSQEVVTGVAHDISDDPPGALLVRRPNGELVVVTVGDVVNVRPRGTFS